jgi:hypothetical protein
MALSDITVIGNALLLRVTADVLRQSRGVRGRC